MVSKRTAIIGAAAALVLGLAGCTRQANQPGTADQQNGLGRSGSGQSQTVQPQATPSEAPRSGMAGGGQEQAQPQPQSQPPVDHNTSSDTTGSAGSS